MVYNTLCLECCLWHCCQLTLLPHGSDKFRTSSCGLFLASDFLLVSSGPLLTTQFAQFDACDLNITKLFVITTIMIIITMLIMMSMMLLPSVKTAIVCLFSLNTMPGNGRLDCGVHNACRGFTWCRVHLFPSCVQ